MSERKKRVVFIVLVLSLLFLFNNKGNGDISHKSHELSFVEQIRLINLVRTQSDLEAALKLSNYYAIFSQNLFRESLSHYYLEIAADLGHQNSQYILGSMYLDDKETLSAGITLLTPIAEKNDQFAYSARSTLAQHYRSAGEYSKARYWYQKIVMNLKSGSESVLDVILRKQYVDIVIQEKLLDDVPLLLGLLEKDKLGVDVKSDEYMTVMKLEQKLLVFLDESNN